MSEQKQPIQRPVSFHYVVVDKRDPTPLTPTVITVGLTRRECNEKITFDPEADHYRVRRVRAVHFEK